MVTGEVPDEDQVEGGRPMQTLRAFAVALPFVGLAVLVALLSMLVVPDR